MDCPQMAVLDKKRAPLENQRGRPRKGALSTYPKDLVVLIKGLREKHEGWGAINILVELEEEYNYSSSDLPSIASLNRYLKSNGFIKTYIRSSPFPKSGNCNKKAGRVHGVWELDAQGAVRVKGIGHQAMINIKDTRSKLHCMAFPVSVGNSNTQPRTRCYYWALRLAFSEWGLPKVIQVDKDAVFYENRSKSPFPKSLHAWLISLGIELCFIKYSPPTNNAIIERAHQTMERQVLKGQGYDCWKSLFQYCNKRRKRMNEKIPNRSLDNKPPLKAFPKAIHSRRPYSIEKEAELIDLKKLQAYLAKCTWYRQTSSAKTLSLGGQQYYLKNAKPNSQLQIEFCNRSKKLIFRDANELFVDKLPIKNLTVEKLMGATTKSLLSMKNKIYRFRNCPL